MPALGLGVFQSRPDETVTAVSEALRVGYPHIDTAAVYFNDREVGEDIRFAAMIQAHRALESLLADGRVRAIGVSSFKRSHLERFATESEIVPAVNQVELHPHFRDLDTQRADDERSIVTQAWSRATAKNAGERTGPDSDNPDPRRTSISRSPRRSGTSREPVVATESRPSELRKRTR